MLNLDIRGRTVFRAILLLPWLLPEVVVANIFKWILHPSNGILNAWLRRLGVIHEPTSWLGSPTYALITVALVCVWKGYSLVMLMVLAGLQTVPHELREAAVVDGASPRAVFWHVTVPALRATLIVALVLNTLWWFKHVTIIWLMTQGGPGTSTTTIAVSIYRQAFENFEFGPASALAVIVFLICLGINFAYKRGLADESV
ncbi:MAG: sugar ABC transporter permease [Propionibacteriaceae bacterium]|nr:sugar ABC transporter permease [Propionibacteriaceae bacterium]